MPNVENDIPDIVWRFYNFDKKKDRAKTKKFMVDIYYEDIDELYNDCVEEVKKQRCD